MMLWQNLRQNSGLADDPEWRRFFLRWSVVSLLLIAIACYFSTGMFKFDEYYQIVEFVSYKLGKTPATALPWEFHDQVRPWLQPFIYYGAAKALLGIGVKSPFVIAMAFRAISGFCGWLAICALMLASRVIFADPMRRRLAVVVLALLWLVPYLAVRTSGESMSCSFFTLGVAALLLGSSTQSDGTRGEPKRQFPLSTLALAGTCFGLAVEFRLQMAFAIVGAMGWIALNTAGGWRSAAGRLTVLSLASALMVALCTAIDCWGYGFWTFAPWNYFHADVVLARPSRDGVSPFWWYFVEMNANPMAPVTLLWTVAIVVTWIRFPRHLVTWVTLPFFLGHSIVPHKELRYLFPMVLIGALCLLLAYVPEPEGRALPDWLRAIWQRRRSGAAMALYGINLLGLVYGCVAATQPSVNFQKYLYDHYPQGCTLCLLGESAKSPYENVGLEMYFYRPPNFQLVRLKSIEELPAIERSSQREVLLVRDRVAPWQDQSSVAPDARLIYRTYPPFVENFNFFSWLEHSKRFSLYAFDGSAQPGSPATARLNDSGPATTGTTTTARTTPPADSARNQ